MSHLRCAELGVAWMLAHTLLVVALACLRRSFRQLNGQAPDSTRQATEGGAR